MIPQRQNWDDFFHKIVIMGNMKKFFAVFFTFIMLLLPCVKAEVIQAGVSIEKVPHTLYGSWRITSKLDTTNAYQTFKPQGTDFWTLTRVNDIITLDNPFTGAKADVSIKSVEGNLISFSRKAAYSDNKLLTDTVTIRIEGNTFSGINYLKLETFSLVDKHILKTETASYIIKGEKIAGESILGN